MLASDKKGAERGLNKIFILDDGEARVAHFGDLGCKLTINQLSILQELDVAMIPVGGFYTINAAEAAMIVRKIQPKHVIPMHYRSISQNFGYDGLDQVSEFTDICDSFTILNTSTYNTSQNTKSQVIVLRPQNAKN